jgi:hypothetical protein
MLRQGVRNVGAFMSHIHRREILRVLSDPNHNRNWRRLRLAGSVGKGKGVRSIVANPGPAIVRTGVYTLCNKADPPHMLTVCLLKTAN